MRLASFSMRRSAALGLVTALIVPVLAACGGTPATPATAPTAAPAAAA
ncbi:MAG: hypothetical protein H7Z42_02485, partial [Roseiflexaceae bacterium]|nr:hypothetical protein [Roseiflexaceae bacterium]